MTRRVLLLAALVLVLSMGSAMADSKKVIEVGSDCTWPPMEYLDDNKQPTGFAVDLLAAMGEALGVEFHVNNVAWDGIFSGVAAGKYDMVSSSVTITPERQKTYLFSEPYLTVTQAVVMPKGKTCPSLESLKGKKVGGQIGTTGIFVMDKANVGAEIKEYDEVGLAMEELRSGRLDAVICDSNVAAYYANVKEGYADLYEIVFRTSEVEELAFCLNIKGEELKKLLDEGLAKVKASGKYDEILAKWKMGS